MYVCVHVELYRKNKYQKTTFDKVLEYILYGQCIVIYVLFEANDYYKYYS